MSSVLLAGPRAPRRPHSSVQLPARCARAASRVRASSGGGSDVGGARKAKASGDGADTGVGLKAVWYGAEAFGNVVGALKGTQQQAAQQQAVRAEPLSRADALAAIRDDFDQVYFISGKGALAAYAPDCRFADPFAAFNGTARFKRNVSNLGGLLADVDLQLLEWREEADALHTRWRFSAVLEGLPWKPLLAAAGGTTFRFDPATGLVTEHVESWDVEPARVLAQLLKPSAKVPATQAEVLMAALSGGDAVGVWYALSSKVTVAGCAASLLLAAAHVVRGEGLGGLEAVVYAATAAALATEMLKIVRSISGGGG